MSRTYIITTDAHGRTVLKERVWERCGYAAVFVCFCFDPVAARAYVEALHGVVA